MLPPAERAHAHAYKTGTRYLILALHVISFKEDIMRRVGAYLPMGAGFPFVTYSY